MKVAISWSCFDLGLPSVCALNPLRARHPGVYPCFSDVVASAPRAVIFLTQCLFVGGLVGVVVCGGTCRPGSGPGHGPCWPGTTNPSAKSLKSSSMVGRSWRGMAVVGVGGVNVVSCFFLLLVVGGGGNFNLNGWILPRLAKKTVGRLFVCFFLRARGSQR